MPALIGLSYAGDVMELIVFVGLQGAGKSTFYKRHLVDTHVRLNLDMLKTRHREGLLFEACLAAKQPTVIDDTNPTVEDRARYIVPAKIAGFSVVAYYFRSRFDECDQRNAQRPRGQIVPLAGMLGTLRRLVVPTLQEGFDRSRYVKIEAGEFVVEEWVDEVR